MTTVAPSLVLTPHGHLRLAPSPDAQPLSEDLQQRLTAAFDRGTGQGLLQLGGGEVATALPAVFAYWREFAVRYVTAVCTSAQAAEGAVIAAPDNLSAIAAAVPPMAGAEYLTEAVLRSLWQELDAALHAELAASKRTLQDFLRRLNPAWNVIGRVHFNLAENRKDEEAPFAFLATYATGLSAHARAQHLPLTQALREYAGARNKSQLLSLLMPVQRAAEQCTWLRQLLDSGEIYHPLRWTPAEALQFLTDVPKLEAAGIVVRAPGTWRSGRPSRPQIRASVGGQAPSQLGAAALLDFNVELMLNGEPLSPGEIKQLLAGSAGLRLLRGRWVEVDPGKLSRLLERFHQAQAAAKAGLSFAEAMRWVSGAHLVADPAGEEIDRDWSQVVAGPWLAQTLRGLRSPQGLAQVDPGSDLKASLRPYQQAGVHWLYLLQQLGLGACLADDMGLGKTMQVLSLLLVLKRQEQEAAGRNEERRASLLVAPASLLLSFQHQKQ